jgi:hypothetical protein
MIRFSEEASGMRADTTCRLRLTRGTLQAKNIKRIGVADSPALSEQVDGEVVIAFFGIFEVRGYVPWLAAAARAENEAAEGECDVK